MATATITVSLPDAMKAYVDAHVAAGEFASGEEFLRHLLQEDIDHRSAAFDVPSGDLDGFCGQQMAELEEKLLAAMKEAPIRISDDEWAHGNIMQIASERLALRG